ncbi:hypothetical protein CR970_04195 [Candidatus Saccharibacteria bacterium]|nr:MAG: hypothetical protein CR970_04195 [Candidatus Saccharibacteria bacterium]
MTRQPKGALFGLRSTLQKTLEEAKKDQNQGDKRTKELEHELTVIGKKIKQTLQKITAEAEASTDPEAERHAKLKQAATLDILQIEMLRLAALYHRQIDVDIIRRFIREQRSIIGGSMEETTKEPSLVSLDEQISELHKTMQKERARVRQNARKDWIKFWVSVIIGLTSLAISLYAIFMS